MRTRIPSLVNPSAKNEIVRNAYESELEDLCKKEMLIKDKLLSTAGKELNFETPLNLVFDILKNPYILWKKPNIESKRLVAKLVFSDKLFYDRNLGFETPKIALPLELFKVFDTKSTKGVEMVGVEPTCIKGS